MRIILIVALFSFYSCSSQDLPKVVSMSEEEELNYAISNINECIELRRSLFDGAYYLNIFKIDDSRATPENYFEGSDEVLESIIIGIIPDGDYYSNSFLYKIEGLLNPKIKTIKEGAYPNIELDIVHGFAGKEVRESFKIKLTVKN